MEILRTGAIECRHAEGECKVCSVRLEQRCRAPQQEPCLDDCTCPQREALVMDAWSAAGHRIQHAVFSHDCPVHGAPIEPPPPKMTGPWTCVDCGTPNQMIPDNQVIRCQRCHSSRVVDVRSR